jgi:hypothetical protein
MEKLKAFSKISSTSYYTYAKEENEEDIRARYLGFVVRF